MKIFRKNTFFILLAATLVCSYFHTHNIFASQQPQNQKTKPKKSKHKGTNKKKVIPAWKGINDVTTGVLKKIASFLDPADQICFARTNNYIHETLGKLGNDSILILNRIDDYERWLSVMLNEDHDVRKNTKTIIFFPVESSLSKELSQDFTICFLLLFPNVTTLIVDGRGSSNNEKIQKRQRLYIKESKIEKIIIKNINNFFILWIAKCHNLKEVILENSNCVSCDTLKKILLSNTNYKLSDKDSSSELGFFYIEECNYLKSIFIKNCTIGNGSETRFCDALKKITIENTEIHGLINVEDCKQLKEVAIINSSIKNPRGSYFHVRWGSNVFLIVDGLCSNLEKISLINVTNKSGISKKISLLSQCFSNLTLEVDGEDVDLNEEQMEMSYRYSSIDPFYSSKVISKNHSCIPL